MNATNRLSLSLLGLRLTVFLVMLMWTLDKFIRPEHAAGVFERFCAVAGRGASAFTIPGALELLLLLAFAMGFSRRFSYGAILLLHAGSTQSSWHQYPHPHEGANMLVFTAWPMLAARVALYLLHDSDAFTVDGARHASHP